MSDKKIIQKIVLGAVVISYDNKVLILQRQENEDVFPGMWEIPSGKREELESSEESLLREVKEEANLDIEIVSPISVFDYQIEKESEVRDSTQINFLVKATNSDDVKISDEHQDFKWVGEKELDNFDISDETKQVIRQAFKLLNTIK